PSAQRRFQTWLIALEFARDDEARERGADGADLAAAIMASIRFLREETAPDAPSYTSSRMAHACLIGYSHVLQERVSRLLGPLPSHAQEPASTILSFEVVSLLLVPLLLLAAFAGALYGAPLLRALLALTSL
ncbi:MAG: hypothetical protein KGO02_08715, partial [Alphaproteobacteria bacterium]|nr:hypothetical protein [Alphaproteobacteria bacterium]